MKETERRRERDRERESVTLETHIYSKIVSEGHDSWDASGIIIVKVLIFMNHLPI